MVPKALVSFVTMEPRGVTDEGDQSHMARVASAGVCSPAMLWLVLERTWHKASCKDRDHFGLTWVGLGFYIILVLFAVFEGFALNS